MRILLIGPTTGLLYKEQKKISEMLTDACHTCTGIYRAPGDTRNIMKEIREFEPELMITEDLEGFEMCTLTDAVSYNLIHCRQLHLLSSDPLSNERYLSKQLSLLMTFVCPNPDRAALLMDKYPDIPEITTLENVPEDIPDEIKNILSFISDTNFKKA